MIKKKLFFIFIAAFIFLLLPKSAFASTLYLSPGGGTIYTGGVTSVQIRLSAGGDAVNGVSAFLSYPADKLDVAWVSAGGAFAIDAERTYGGGIIKVSRGNINPVSGDVNVATIGFRGKSAGSAAVSFIGGSQAPRASDSSDSLNLGGSRGGVFNVVAGGAPVKAAQENPKNTSPGTPAVQLLISDIKVTSVSTNSAEVTWKTNSDSDSLVDYGLEKDKYFLSASDGNLTLNHSIKLENPFLTAGQKLHFRVKSKDSGGREASGEDQTLQLTGYQVRVKVVDEAGNPVSGVEVQLYSDPIKAVTGTNGEAVFENISPGRHLAVVKSANGDQSTEVQVLATTSQKATYSQIKINKKPAIGWNSPQVLVAAGLITVLAVGGVIVIFKRRKKKAGPPSGGVTAPVMVTPVNITNLPRPPVTNQSG